jgi:hypothetical protein
MNMKQRASLQKLLQPSDCFNHTAASCSDSLSIKQPSAVAWS